MRTKYSIKNSFYSFMCYLISFVFGFLSQTIFIKILGIEYTGLNNLFSNVISFLNLFEFGFGSALTYILYKSVAENNKEEIKSIVKFSSKIYKYIIGIIFVLGMILFPFIKLFIKEVSIDINIYIVYLLFLMSTLVTYFLAYKRSVIIAHQKNYVIKIIQIIYIFILKTVQLMIIYFTKNYYLFLVVRIIFIVLENLFISHRANKDYPYLKEKNIDKLDSNIEKSIKDRVKALFIHKASYMVSNFADNIFISSFFGLTIYGLYSNYYLIIYYVDSFFRNIFTAVGSSIGNLLVEKNKSKSYDIFCRVRFLIFWIVLFTSVCLINLIEPFISIWLGGNYLLGKMTLVVLVINYYQEVMGIAYKLFKDGAGIWIEDKYVAILQVVSNVIISFILIKLIGFSGIFIGTIISSCLIWFYSFPKFIYNKLFGKDYLSYLIRVIKSILLFIFVSSITYFLNSFVSVSNMIFDFGIRLLICIIVPNVILLIIYHRSYEFKYYLNLIKKMFKKTTRNV